jgi:cobalt/nickel transport system permease protein
MRAARNNKECGMHVPDGFLDVPTSVATGAVAAGGLAYCLAKGSAALDDRQVPMAGMVAAFIFAVQMLNFPVVSGTSGHLLGGCLAAVLVGPHLGALAVSVVLLVQALLFADGGLSALGTNIILIALVPAFLGYSLFRLVRLVVPRSRGGVVVAAGVAAFLSVVVASLVFGLLYAVGGEGSASPGTVIVAMVGVHVLIGIGEGIITALVVGAVLAVRPDLVVGARDLQPALRLQPAGVG